MILKKYISGKNAAGRYGGEEFVVIFDGGSKKEQYNLLEKIREEFENSS